MIQATGARQHSILKASMTGHSTKKSKMEAPDFATQPSGHEHISDQARYQQIHGSLEESAVTSRKLLELNPAYATAQGQYAMTLLLMGKDAEALAAAKQESDDASKLLALACIYWAMSRTNRFRCGCGCAGARICGSRPYAVARRMPTAASRTPHSPGSSAPISR